MKKYFTAQNVFRSCMLLTVLFLICYVLSYFATEMNYVPEYEYPQAYGRTTLEYSAEPMVKLVVWQKNDVPFDEKTKPVCSPEYFTKKPLVLEEGASLTFAGEDAADMNMINYYTFTLLYPGKIAGGFDVKMPYFLYYEHDDTRVPGNWGPSFTRSWQYVSYVNDDASFEGASSITFGFPYLTASDYADYYRNGTAYTPKVFFSNWIDRYETSDEFDFDRFFRVQSFDEAYPDSPKLLHDFERNVVTLRLSFEAYDLQDSKTVVAEGVIAVRYYSAWHKLYTSSVEEEAFRSLGYPNEKYVEITVEKYAQTDRLSMRG